MGNNFAYSCFEFTVITLADRKLLDLELLDILASDYAGMDIDSGGSRDLLTKEGGKTLEEVCIALVDPEWKAESDPDTDDFYDEWYKKWCSIQSERWHWE